MTRKARLDSLDEPLTLSDADITSQRAVTRRSLLGVLGITAGAAATVAFGTTDDVFAADAADAKDKKKKKKPPEESDSD